MRTSQSTRTQNRLWGPSGTLTSERADWRPSEPPDLSGEDELVVDLETNGLRWFDATSPSMPGGIAVLGRRSKRRWYLPFGHRGGNLDPETVRRWAREQLRNKMIWNLNTRFDNHEMRVWGVDLEEQGCRLGDVGHLAALLDDHRQRFSLEAISQDYLGRGKRLDLNLDGSRMMEYHAAEVEPYALTDVELPDALLDIMLPRIAEEGLTEVAQLESDLIYVVCEMERNGAIIDQELLERWNCETEQRYLKLCSDLRRAVGFEIHPTKSESLVRMFEHLGLENNVLTGEGDKSFADGVLSTYQHPAVKDLREARALASLRSKFLVKYASETAGGALLRYALHQLRFDREGGSRVGTVSGRFSCTGHSTHTGLPDGVNIQQVANVKKQGKKLGGRYDVRRLFVPGPGMLWFKADAMQIEYRLFAHYANSEKINAAYRKDPRTDFHNLVMAMIRELADPNISRERTKDVNFAKLFGAGIDRTADMLGLPVEEVRAFVESYDESFPEAKALMNRAKTLAKKRGFVKTMLGRRSRFPDGQYTHKAVSRAIQGTAADVNKLKLRELYRARKRTGMVLRFTVHDENNGDVPDLESARTCARILDDQSLPTRIPILWEWHAGSSWAGDKAA